MSHFTILGAGGFIGSALARDLRAAGHQVDAIGRDNLPDLLSGRAPAGHVIYAIGLTADFRERPLDTAEAHVGLVARALRTLDCESFLYLSSTRVYGPYDTTREDAPISVRPEAAGEVYNLTKLAGEALVLSMPRSTFRVARLSNVYGPAMGTGSFLGQLFAEGKAGGVLAIRQNLRTAKDYVALDDVTRLLPAIALAGGARIYNVASGQNVTHDAIASTIARHTGWRIEGNPDAGATRHPRIDITRLTTEFAAPQGRLLDALPTLIRQEVAC